MHRAYDSKAATWCTQVVDDRHRGRRRGPRKEWGKDEDLEERPRRKLPHSPWFSGVVREDGSHVPLFNPPMQCANCHRTKGAGQNQADEHGFARCKGCRKVWYCGADCQKVHWQRGHYAVCDYAVKMRAEHVSKAKAIVPPSDTGGSAPVEEKKGTDSPQKAVRRRKVLDVPHLPTPIKMPPKDEQKKGAAPAQEPQVEMGLLERVVKKAEEVVEQQQEEQEQQQEVVEQQQQQEQEQQQEAAPKDEAQPEAQPEAEAKPAAAGGAEAEAAPLQKSGSQKKLKKSSSRSGKKKKKKGKSS